MQKYRRKVTLTVLPPTVKNGHKNNTPLKCATTDSYSIHERFLLTVQQQRGLTPSLPAPLFSYSTITSLNKLITQISFRICPSRFIFLSIAFNDAKVNWFLYKEKEYSPTEVWEHSDKFRFTSLFRLVFTLY